jgi:hypothetical protein
MAACGNFKSSFCQLVPKGKGFLQKKPTACPVCIVFDDAKHKVLLCAFMDTASRPWSHDYICIDLINADQEVQESFLEEVFFRAFGQTLPCHC